MPRRALGYPPNPVPPPAQRLAVDSDPTLFLTSLAVNISLSSQEAGDPDQSAALIELRRAANLIARLKGNGSKRPLLIMGHSDTVKVDPAKWTFPPFSATRDGGYVYGRGTLDDKPNLMAAMMGAG